MTQAEKNFIDDLWQSWEDEVRKFIWSNLEDQDLLDALYIHIENNGTSY